MLIVLNEWHGKSFMCDTFISFLGFRGYELSRIEAESTLATSDDGYRYTLYNNDTISTEFTTLTKSIECGIIWNRYM